MNRSPDGVAKTIATLESVVQYRFATLKPLKGPLARLYWRRLPGLVRGRLHSTISRAMKPRSGSASRAVTKLVHLISLGEVVQRLGRGFADRFHRATHTGEGITDGNQLAALTLHGFSFSHVPQTRQGHRADPTPLGFSVRV